MVPEFLPPSEEPNGEAAAALVDQEVDDYMDRILQRAREWSQLQEEEERPEKPPARGRARC